MQHQSWKRIEQKREGSFAVENTRLPSFPSRRKIDMLTIHHSQAGSASLTTRALLLVALVCVFVASTLAQNLPDVTAMSVEDLMNVQVTSVSKRSQKLADAAAPPAFRKHCEWFLVCRWLVSMRTSGPSARAVSMAASPTNCWF